MLTAGAVDAVLLLSVLALATPVKGKTPMTTANTAIRILRFPFCFSISRILFLPVKTRNGLAAANRSFD
uniref:Uncharacterized protein n=1 Tax=mine drainage metagenome TaxID=410659 RepID=E6QE88_9ZZZZ